MKTTNNSVRVITDEYYSTGKTNSIIQQIKQNVFKGFSNKLDITDPFLFRLVLMNLVQTKCILRTIPPQSSLSMSRK